MIVHRYAPNYQAKSPRFGPTQPQRCTFRRLSSSGTSPVGQAAAKKKGPEDLKISGHFRNRNFPANCGCVVQYLHFRYLKWTLKRQSFTRFFRLFEYLERETHSKHAASSRSTVMQEIAILASAIYATS